MLGLLALLGAAFLDEPSDNADYDDFGVDEDLKPCTREWRSRHPFGFNQYTGGWDEEDEENG